MGGAAVADQHIHHRQVDGQGLQQLPHLGEFPGTAQVGGLEQEGPAAGERSQFLLQMQGEHPVADGGVGVGEQVQQDHRSMMSGPKVVGNRSGAVFHWGLKR